MSSPDVTRLVHRDGAFDVRRGKLIKNCSIFTSGEVPFSSHYEVRSVVSLDNLALFVEAIHGNDIPITEQIFQLCSEFGFSRLRDRIDLFRQRISSELPHDDCCPVLTRLEEMVCGQARQLASLQSDLSHGDDAPLLIRVKEMVCAHSCQLATVKSEILAVRDAF
jgi:hypothetical protein